jgi:L-fuculose-phosphate aldolase
MKMMLKFYIKIYIRRIIMSKTIRYELKSALIHATKKFVELDYTPTSDLGDLSLRDPETGYIYFSPNQGVGMDIPEWSIITEDDIVVTDSEGRIVDGRPGVLPTCEFPMHLAIYKARPDANAIVHSHCIYSSAFAVAGKSIPLVLSETRKFGGDILCSPEFGPAGSKVLADGVVWALGKTSKAALVKNHGAACIGANFREAFQVSILVEKLAQTAILASSIGELVPIPEEFRH